MINKLKLLATGFVVVGMAMMSGCLEQEELVDPSIQLNKEVTAVDNYLLANAGAITGAVIKDPSGLRFVIDQMGSELPARSTGSKVSIKFVGYIFNSAAPNGFGAQFDQGTWGNNLNSVINGWKIAFTKLPIGTKGKVYIPSYWAYGTDGRAGSPISIPGNTTLVFNVEYEDVTITDTEFATWKTDTTAIETYLENKNITNYDTITFLSGSTTEPKRNIGVRYVLTPGAGVGNKAKWFDWVNVKVKYYLLTNDATIVYQDIDLDTRAVDLLPGLNAGLQQMKKGDKATFYIPSGWAFGPNGYTGSTFTFPANSNLKVEVELVDFVTP